MRKLFYIYLCLTIFSCEEIIEVPDISEKTIVVLAPTDSVILSENLVNFSWEAVEDVDTYRLQIATPSFENAEQIVKDTTITNTSISVNLSAANYQWRVQGQNEEYQTPYTTQNLTVEE